MTDIHGSDVCFRKFINAFRTSKNPDVVIIGGDITGKWLVPIEMDSQGLWRSNYADNPRTFDAEADLQRYETELANAGAYSIRCSKEFSSELKRNAELVEETLKSERIKRLTKWVDLVDKNPNIGRGQIVINAGNDDSFYTDDVLKTSKSIVFPEGYVLDFAE